MDAEDQDDEFEDYNPHPYQGGYDIALTYGQPLPPSPAICYPIASPSPAAAPPPEKTPPAAAPLPPPPQEPKPVPAPPSAPVEAPKPAPEPEQHAPYVNAYNDSWYDYRCGYPEQSLWDLGYGERGYWRQLSRAADYLFGYSQGCGERIIGADRYGIPIYANKKHGHEEPLSVQIEPASAQKVDYYDASDDEVYPIKNWPEERIEKDGYYETDQPPYLQVNPIETFWSQEPSYNELYQEREYAQYEQVDEKNHSENTIDDYKKNYNEPPHFDQLEPYEPTWTRIRCYYEPYNEEGYDSHEKNAALPFQNYEE